MPRGYSCERRYGVVIFHEPTNVGKGWACVSGASPFYVTSSADLDTSITWLTNVDLSILHRKSLFQIPHLKADGYLRTALSRILIELGLRGFPSDQQANVLCKLFSTVMQFYRLHIGRDDVPEHMLNDGIRYALAPEELPITHDVRDACESAINSHITRDQQRAFEQSVLTSLAFHRFEYAKAILGSDVPAGPWNHVSSSLLTKSRSYLSHWIRELNRPALIRVTVESASATIKHLVKFDAWMTSIEYVELSQYAELNVKDMFIGQSFEHSAVTVPDWGVAADNSYAFGLYCESIWTSLTRTLEGHVAYSPLSAWVRSVDRLKCLEKAIAIEASEAVVVQSYGYGRITLLASASEGSHMNDIACRHNMIAPMVVEPHERTQQIVRPNAPRVELMQNAMERGAIDFIERTNSMALSDAIERYEKIYI